MKYYLELVKALALLMLLVAVTSFIAGVFWSVIAMSFNFAKQLIS